MRTRSIDEIYQLLGARVMRREYDQTASELVPSFSPSMAAVQGATRAHYRRIDILAQSTAGISQPMACTKGCSSCCHGTVAVTAHEAFVLGEAILSIPDAGQRHAIVSTLYKQATQQHEGATADAQSSAPCALLDGNGACSVHDARPTACRKHHSFDVRTCRSTGAGVGTAPDPRVPTSRSFTLAAEAASEGFRSATRDSGLDATEYEMSSALCEYLSDRIASRRRYESGEPAFLRAIVPAIGHRPTVGLPPELPRHQLRAGPARHARLGSADMTTARPLTL